MLIVSASASITGGQTILGGLMSKTKRTTRYVRSEQDASPATGKKVRYAVVGLGYISQVAVLPAFQHTRENSELVALVSGDATMLLCVLRALHLANAEQKGRR